MWARRLCNLVIKKRSNAATQQRSNAATQQRSNGWRYMHRACVVSAVSLLTSIAAAQFVPPPTTAIRWAKQTGGDWDIPTNWAPASTPDAGDDVLFGFVTGGPVNPNEPTITVTNNDARTLRSLWFDAASGIFYTLGGTGTLTLGDGLPDDDYLIAVAPSWSTQPENNISNAIVLDDTISGRTRWIVNHSQGGLSLGGLVDLGAQNLIISGLGATHLSGALSGTGSISTVNAFAYASPHLILQADNSTWSGALNVGVKTFAVIKANGALGTGTNTVVAGGNPLAGGGTLAFRSHVGSTLNYTAAAQTVHVSGAGAVRTLGRPGVGAIYHDGGDNTFVGNITISGSTYLGARGDAGGLTLSGVISGSGFLYKIGSGLIELTNANNAAFSRLSIDEGVLRVTDPAHLASPIWFGGSKLLFPNTNGILELSGSLTDVTLALGTGAGQVYWNGRGGFSAFGGDRKVTLNVPGGILRWGRRGHPTGSGGGLLLSSRYADSKITLNNSIDLYGYIPIYVARGSTLDARAEISGALTGSEGWFHKVGAGRLDIIGTNTYSMPTDISDGVLVGHIPDASNLYLGGGVFGLKSDFTRDIGSGAKQIRWEIGRSGGFAGYGGDNAVRLNGTTVQIDWETNHFVKTGDELRFGHYTADGTVLWDKQLGLGTAQHRAINVERGIPAAAANRADVSFTQAISGTGGALTIKGDGRIDISVDNPDLKLGEIQVNGAELRLQQAGRIAAQATNFVLKNGGTLSLDNLGTHKATTGGSYEGDRIHDGSKITLNASTLRYWGSDLGTSEEEVGTVTLDGGANTIEVQNSGSAPATLEASGLNRNSFSTADLTLGSLAKLIFNSWTETNQADEINDGSGTPIIPWITVNGLDWATSTPSGIAKSLSALTASQYHTGNEDTWTAAHNVASVSGQVLSESRSLNSLKLASDLDLGNYTLTINSGGLLVSGNRTLSGSGTVTTQSRPLYSHVYGGNLTLGGGVQLDAPRLVKTGSGSLIFNSSATHALGNIHIHQGTVDLQQGSISASHIVIGDGAGKDTLILPANRWEPLANKPEVTLRGTPYGPGAEYASYNPDEAILRLGGNTKQHLAKLTIIGRGTIDFAGGDVSFANMLWVDELVIAEGDRLFIRNWYQYEDYLLVKKVNNGALFNPAVLSRIHFDGYQDYPVLAVDYDAHYFMITPFHAPEPATYGAILGAVGLGLWSWRKRKAEPTR